MTMTGGQPPGISPGSQAAPPRDGTEGLGHPVRQARHHLPRRRPVRVHNLDPHTGEATSRTSFPRM